MRKVRRSQSRKVQTPRSKKMMDYRNSGSEFPAFRGPRYTRKEKYPTSY
jgi:hypothetical protein